MPLQLRNKLMSEIPGQSGHALPDVKPPVCAMNGSQRFIR